MPRMPDLFTLPKDLELWILLGYVAIVLVGARVSEWLARIHFERAKRYAEHGFEYDPHTDYYRCPEGERLDLHRIEEQRLAVYRAPASSCNTCRLKQHCTPHDEGRHLYRPLAEWAETDIGRFHRRLSLLMLCVSIVLSTGALVLSIQKPGSGMLILSIAASSFAIRRNLSASVSIGSETSI